MAVLKGNAASIRLVGDEILECQNWSLDIGQEMVDTTSFGDTFREQTATFATWSATAKGNYDKTDTTGQVALQTAILAGTPVADVRFYVDAASYYWGPAYVSGAFSADVAGIVEANWTFAATGPLAYVAS